ncbi:hypothetical protein GCM10023310_72290 [Paenibacillus vulneris]|uniref:Uncharacterized protein n=1 Tax=Paenibacillus vulneris TaxID=1133364 RepID=A0ABW3UEW5_9BACL
MSTITSKLQLTVPSLEDEVHQTIQDLANNFQKIDTLAENYAHDFPTSGYYRLGNKVWNNNPQSGNYVGWVNTREGQAAPVWKTLTTYVVGDYVFPMNNNGHYYECIQAGRSGVTEPSFSTVAGDIISDTRNGETWKASRLYQLNDIVFPFVDNNRFYVCATSGVSASTEPSWSLTDGGITSDGSVIWKGYRITKWQTKGTSCHFKPFGKIE